MTTGKTIALTRRTFVGKVISLLLYMDSWAVVNGFGVSVMGIRKVGLEGARRSSEETYG